MSHDLLKFLPVCNSLLQRVFPHVQLSTVKMFSFCLDTSRLTKALCSNFSCIVYLHNCIYHLHLLFRLLLFDIFQTKSFFNEGKFII